VRRRLRTGGIGLYVCAGPAGLPLVALVRSRGLAGGWRSVSRPARGLCGLDQHQVRRWGSWYRWVTLAMLAYAFLVVVAVTEHARQPAPPGAVELTCNEIQHLFAALVAVPWLITATGCAGRGGAISKRALGPATTADKPTDREDHDLRLEY
jgi:hypothetical protein